MTIPNITTSLPCVTPLAHASPVHGFTDFVGGLTHPFLGLDHLLAVLAVGMWAVQMGGRARWMLPVAFVIAMAFGLLGGMSVPEIPLLEHGVIGSVMVFGLVLALASRPGTAAAALLTASLGLFHGLAHGMEQSAAGSAALGYGLGIGVATLMIQFAGSCIATVLGRLSRLPMLRIAGCAVCIAGIVLFAVMLPAFAR